MTMSPHPLLRLEVVPKRVYCLANITMRQRCCIAIDRESEELLRPKFYRPQLRFPQSEIP